MGPRHGALFSIFGRQHEIAVGAATPERAVMAAVSVAFQLCALQFAMLRDMKRAGARRQPSRLHGLAV